MRELPQGVVLAGRGVAAATAAHCLVGRGVDVKSAFGGKPAPFTPPIPARPAPVVMLGEQAQALLGDVFAGHAALTDTLARGHRIARRLVCWGDETPRSFPHNGLILSGERLGAALPPPQENDSEPSAAAFTLDAVGGQGECSMRHFGSRRAAGAPVVLAEGVDSGAVQVETLDAGWLFLMPVGDGTGWLLSVGGDPDACLGQSRLVAPAIAELGEVEARFETAPRIADDLADHAGLRIGSRAVAFDPICGDGTAMAVRGGLLAGAVAAAVCGVDRPLLDPVQDGPALGAHYRAMVIAAMRRHLAASLPFYTHGGRSDWWQEEAAALAEGHAWCTRQLAEAGEPGFVLAGDRLVRRDRVA